MRFSTVAPSSIGISSSISVKPYPLLREWPLRGDEKDPPAVLDLMHRVTLIPMVRRTLFGPRITVFTKDGKSYTREGTGREFVFDYEGLVKRIGAVGSGMAISEARYGELIDACRKLDTIDDAARKLIGLTVQ